MINYFKERLSIEDVRLLLNDFDAMFSPALSSNVDINSFAEKLSENAFFILCKSEKEVVGYIAFYENCETKIAYIPSICVRKTYRSKGVASQMLKFLVSQSPKDINYIALEVRKNNNSAIRFYKRHGFVAKEDRGIKIFMTKDL